MSDERKPLWPWIVALLIGLPVLYVASFGPACWLADRQIFSCVEIYRPLAKLAARCPGPVRDAYDWYAGYDYSPIDSAGHDLLVEEWKRIHVPVEFAP
jgi:hypothetical protein